jgi:hypothetical protein
MFAEAHAQRRFVGCIVEADLGAVSGQGLLIAWHDPLCQDFGLSRLGDAV